MMQMHRLEIEDGFLKNRLSLGSWGALRQEF